MGRGTVGYGNNGQGYLYSHEDGTHEQFSPYDPYAGCRLYVRGKRCVKALIWRNRPRKKVKA